MIKKNETEFLLNRIRYQYYPISFPAAGLVLINHYLGKKPDRIVVCSIDANANIWFTDVNEQTLKVNASAPCNVTLEVW